MDKDTPIALLMSENLFIGLWLVAGILVVVGLSFFIWTLTDKARYHKGEAALEEDLVKRRRDVADRQRLAYARRHRAPGKKTHRRRGRR